MGSQKAARELATVGVTVRYCSESDHGTILTKIGNRFPIPLRLGNSWSAMPQSDNGSRQQEEWRGESRGSISKESVETYPELRVCLSSSSVCIQASVFGFDEAHRAARSRWWGVVGLRCEHTCLRFKSCTNPRHRSTPCMLILAAVGECNPDIRAGSRLSRSARGFM